MSASKVVIGYSLALGTVRWVLLPDDDGEIDHPWHRPGHGESRIIVSAEEYTQNAPQELVNRYTGRNAVHGVDDRFVVLNERNEVVAAIIDDPACHPDWSRHPYVGFRLLRHNEATAGWIHTTEAGFIAPATAEEENQ